MIEKDSQIFKLIEAEEERQESTLNLIASENYPSKAVREALSSVFIVKYSEGRPGKRYYAGTENVDKLEILVEERVKKVFFNQETGFAVNVQPYSGSPANYAVLRGLLDPGDKILSISLSAGGHLSHGSPISIAGQDFKIVNYFLNKETNLLDYEEIEKTAIREKPRLIICGYTAYSREVDFKRFKEIADKIGAFLLADIAHIAGLVAGGVHPSPIPWADVITLTTHKTLRGPRGAIIICRDELKDKIFPKVFPGLQGGPHNHTICAIGVALGEALQPEFREYARQVVANAKALALALKKHSFKLVSGGTDNHVVLIDLSDKNISGKEAQELLERAGIVVNKNTIPYDAKPPANPSGIRLGTSALTTRGMKEPEMKRIAFWINEVISRPESFLKVKEGIKEFCQQFPLP